MLITLSEFEIQQAAANYINDKFDMNIMADRVAVYSDDNSFVKVDAEIDTKED
jgi:hypothetical protein